MINKKDKQREISHTQNGEQTIRTRRKRQTETPNDKLNDKNEIIKKNKEKDKQGKHHKHKKGEKKSVRKR